MIMEHLEIINRMKNMIIREMQKITANQMDNLEESDNS